MIGPLIKGFLLTARHMFKKPVTVNYPYQKVPVFPKYRGKQVLMRDENGLEKCVACGLCSVACPADAIYLEAAENDGTVLAGPRYASVYQIHKTRVGRVQQGRLRVGQGRPPRRAARGRQIGRERLKTQVRRLRRR